MRLRIGWAPQILLSVLAFCASSAFAQSVVMGLPTEEFTNEISPSQNRFQLQFQQSQYLGETQNNIQTNSYSSLGARLQLAGPLSFWTPLTGEINSGGLDLMALGTVDGTEQVYVAAPEFYLAKSIGMSRLVLGRNRREWSAFDREWRLGIWQPYVRWDYLHPREQGLTGLFFDVGGSEAKVTLFASGLFLPDQGPEFEVVDGEFHSSNRWFRQPTSRINVLNRESDLIYSLDRPSEDEVVFRPSFGAMVEMGDSEEGLWLRLAFASKPINQLHVAIENYHSISASNRPFDSLAIVHPLVARHELASVEAGWTGDEIRGWVSLTDERPVSPDVPSQWGDAWAQASLAQSRYWGGTVAHRLPWRGVRGHWFKYAFMRMAEKSPGGRDQEREVLQSSLNRYPYQDVASFEWVAPIWGRSRSRLDAGLRYLYSIPEEGGLISANVQWVVDRGLRLDFGVDVLGSKVSGDSPNAGLMTKYRNNDRIMGAMTYVY